jgi:hypothetical protein
VLDVADAPTTSVIIVAIGSIISGSLLGIAKVIEAIAKLVEARDRDEDDDDRTRRKHRRRRHRRDDEEDEDDGETPLSLIQARLAI